MVFLVELDYVNSGALMRPEAGRAFIEQIILPTLARAEQLLAENKIVAGGPVIGRLALRFILQADSLPDVDRLISSLPLWPLAQTRVTPLGLFADRRQSVQNKLEDLANTPLH